MGRDGRKTHHQYTMRKRNFTLLKVVINPSYYLYEGPSSPVTFSGITLIYLSIFLVMKTKNIYFVALNPSKWFQWYIHVYGTSYLLKMKIQIFIMIFLLFKPFIFFFFFSVHNNTDFPPSPPVDQDQYRKHR